MKRTLKVVIVTLIILTAATVGMICLFHRNHSSDTLSRNVQNEQSDQNDKNSYTREMQQTAVPLLLKGDQKNVLNFDTDPAYDVARSKEARERLDRVIKKTDATLEHPIIAADPFGTNRNSFYFYFTTPSASMVRYRICVEDDSIADFVRYVDCGEKGNVSKIHEFIVLGLVPGCTNYIRIELLNKKGELTDKYLYSYEAPALADGEGIPVSLKQDTGKSKDQAENGIYCLLPSDAKDIYLYDNRGVLRGVIGTEGKHGQRVYEDTDQLFYMVSDTKIVKISDLGQVVGVAQMKGYSKILDFCYDGYDNVYCLTRKKGRNVLVSISFSTGKTKKVFDFTKGVRVSSISNASGGGIYAACEKPAGLMRIDALTSQKALVRYILGVKKTWKKTSWKKKVRSDVVVKRWDFTDTMLHFDEKATNQLSAYVYDLNKGTGVQFSVSDTDKKASQLQTLPVGNADKSDAFTYGEHMIISNLVKGQYAEYDAKGRAVTEFFFEESLQAVCKLKFENIYFWDGR